MNETGQKTLAELLDEIEQYTSKPCSDRNCSKCRPNRQKLALTKGLRIVTDAIAKTLHNQRHLADGENCTLIELKRAQRSLSAHLNVTVAASGNLENSSPASDSEPASSSR